MDNVSLLIERLGGSAALGRVIGKGASTVSEMKRRGSIPVEYWPALRAEADRLGIEITYDRLVEMHQKHHEVSP